MLRHTDGAKFEVEPIVERLPSGLLAIVATGSEERRRIWISFVWKRSLTAWLRRVKREIETPDLWRQFKAPQKLLEASPTHASDNAVFTPEEQAEIREHLEEIRVHALNSGDFTDEELGRLNTKIDELIESSRRVLRFEWRDQVVGALLGAVAGNVLPQGATLEVLQMVIRSIGHLFGQPGLLHP
jgi:hypothetical protein